MFMNNDAYSLADTEKKSQVQWQKMRYCLLYLNMHLNF